MKPSILAHATFQVDRQASQRRTPNVSTAVLIGFAAACAVACSDAGSTVFDHEAQSEDMEVDHGTIIFEDSNPEGIRVEVREFADQNLSMLVTSPIGKSQLVPPSVVAFPESLAEIYLVVHPETTQIPLEILELSERLAENTSPARDSSANVEPSQISPGEKSYGTFLPFATATYFASPYKYMPKSHYWNNSVYEISTANWLDKWDRSYYWNKSPSGTCLAWYAQNGSFSVQVGCAPANSTGFTTYTGSSGPSGDYSYYVTMSTGQAPGVQPGEMGLTAHWQVWNGPH